VKVSDSAILGDGTASSNNTVLVSGNSSLVIGGYLDVGDEGSFNALTISQGGSVEVTGDATLGYLSTSSNNTVLVNGANSSWTNRGLLAIGYQGGNNTLTVANNGTVSSFGGISIAFQAGSGGTLNIGTFGASGAGGMVPSPSAMAPARSISTKAMPWPSPPTSPAADQSTSSAPATPRSTAQTPTPATPPSPQARLPLAMPTPSPAAPLCTAMVPPCVWPSPARPPTTSAASRAPAPLRPGTTQVGHRHAHPLGEQQLLRRNVALWRHTGRRQQQRLRNRLGRGLLKHDPRPLEPQHYEPDH